MLFLPLHHLLSISFEAKKYCEGNKLKMKESETSESKVVLMQITARKKTHTYTKSERLSSVSVSNQV